MANHEKLDKFEKDPRYEEALRYCQELKDALELAKKLNGSDEPSDNQIRQAQAAAESVIHQGVFGGLPFRLNISIPEGVKAEISKSWEIIDAEPHHFEATEVRYIGKDQVDFHDGESDHWLVVYGHTLEIIPLFPPSAEINV